MSRSPCPGQKRRTSGIQRNIPTSGRSHDQKSVSLCEPGTGIGAECKEPNRAQQLQQQLERFGPRWRPSFDRSKRWSAGSLAFSSRGLRCWSRSRTGQRAFPTPASVRRERKCPGRGPRPSRVRRFSRGERRLKIPKQRTARGCVSHAVSHALWQYERTWFFLRSKPFHTAPLQAVLEKLAEFSLCGQ